MENASKALLIAGSVLIAIILIAMGIRILNSTNGTTDAVETTMSAAEIAMFNKKFTRYEGTHKKASEIKAILYDLIENNEKGNYQVGAELDKKGYFQNNWMQELINNGLDAGKTYTVEVLIGDGAEHSMTINNGKGWEYTKTTPGIVYRVKIITE